MSEDSFEVVLSDLHQPPNLSEPQVGHGSGGARIFLKGDPRDDAEVTLVLILVHRW